MRSFHKPLFILTVLLLLGLACASHAEPRDVGVATDFWPPFRIEQPDGSITGIDVDLMKLVGKEMGVHFDINIYPWPRCLRYMKGGVQDIMTGVAKTAGRTEYIVYSEIPYYSCSPAFYARKNHDDIVREYEDLRGQVIGYTRDSAYFTRFDSDTGLRKFDKNNELQLLKMLAAGRLDLIIGTDCQVDYDIMRLGLQGTIQKMPYQPEDKVKLYIGISHKSPFLERLDELNRVLKKFVDEGMVERIAEDYMKASPESR